MGRSGARLRVIDVRDYGAVCDGATDDTAAWTAAVAALGSAVGALFVSGVSVCDPDVIVLNSGQWLIGDAYERSRVLQRAGTSGTALVSSHNFGTLTGTDTSGSPYNLGLRDVTVDGNRANTSGTTKGVALYAYGLAITNVRIRGCKGDGLYTEWATTSSSPGNDSMEGAVLNLKVVNCAGTGINFHGPHDTQFTNVIVAQNGAGSGSVAVDTSSDARTNGSIFNQVHVWGGQYDYGFRIRDSGLQLVGCQVEGAILAQVRIDASINSIVASKLFSGGVNTTAKGLLIASGVNNIVADVKVENLTGAAVDLTSSGGDHRLTVQYQCYGGVVAASPAIVGTVDASTYLNLVTIPLSGVAQAADCHLWTPGDLSATNVVGYPVSGQMSTTRIETAPRATFGTNASLSGGFVLFTYFTPDKTLTVSNLYSAVKGTLSSGATLCKMGLYSVNGSSDLTCIARTASDTAMWSSSGITAALPIVDDGAASPGAIGSVTLTRGVRYAVGFLQVTGTMPQLLAQNSTGGVLFQAPIMASTSGGSQTDLGATYAHASVSSTNAFFYAAAA